MKQKIKNYTTRNLKGIGNTFRYRISKKYISNNDYRLRRMELMAENIIYWKNYSINRATLFTEREFCKQMEDMYFKRFMYYKNKV